MPSGEEGGGGGVGGTGIKQGISYPLSVFEVFGTGYARANSDYVLTSQVGEQDGMEEGNGGGRIGGYAM